MRVWGLSVCGVTRVENVLRFSVFTTDRGAANSNLFERVIIEMPLDSVRLLAHMLPENDPALKQPETAVA